MNNLTLLSKTPLELNRLLAKRISAIRKRRKITQRMLSEKSGVSLGSLKRFEQTGEISLLSFTKLAVALEIDSELEALFEEVPFASIEEIIRQQ
ncbi:MAG: helix-turn-helix transcriptional regulator [bacterium]|nr:helix-turn-helix transcriptional regulator [bacterium]